MVTEEEKLAETKLFTYMRGWQDGSSLIPKDEVIEATQELRDIYEEGYAAGHKAYYDAWAESQDKYKCKLIDFK